jgi:cytochrome c biogenesis protein CcmG/thiol:disulfide interchange protein DsbE
VRRAAAIAVCAGVAALLAVLAYGVASQGTDRSIDTALASGQRVAATHKSLPVLGGSGKRSLGDYRGKVVLLNFWASWCPPCTAELPLLERAQRRMDPRGGTILGVSYKDIPEDAIGFVHRFGLSYPSLRDRDGDYAHAFATSGIPETFAIDRRGRIAAARRGPVTERWLARTLPPLLAESDR